MTLAIEQLVKLHDAQAIGLESMGAGKGKGILTKEQQIGAFAAAQRKCAVGFDVLMVKHCQDKKAERRLNAAIVNRLTEAGTTFAVQACLLVVSLVSGRVLPSRHKKIASLLRRHSRKAQHTRRLTDACNDTIREMERRGGDPEYIKSQHQRVSEMRQALHDWSESEALRATVCPRCSGTAIVKVTQACPECAGTGRIICSVDDIRESLRIYGTSITSAEWSEKWLPVVSGCLQWLYQQESEASDTISRRIRDELRSVA